MRVYLACWFSEIGQMKKHAEEIRGLGIEVTSRWIEEEYDPTDPEKPKNPDSFRTARAVFDLEDIAASDALVVWSCPRDNPKPGGGRIFEAGYAYGIGKPVIVYGPAENVFFNLPNIQRFEDLEQVKQCLVKMRFNREFLNNHPNANNPIYQGKGLRTTLGNYSTVSSPNIL